VKYIGGLVTIYFQSILFLYRQGLLASGMPSGASLIAMEYRVKFRTANSSTCTAKYCMRAVTLPKLVEIIRLKFILLFEYKIKRKLS
jgi:hypothetical protein